MAGFSLTELLVALSIMLILAAMATGAITAAKGSQKKLSTRDAVSKLHSIIASHYASYRRLDPKVNPDFDSEIDDPADHPDHKPPKPPVTERCERSSDAIFPIVGGLSRSWLRRTTPN